MKTEITFDHLNIYVRKKIPTNIFLKIFLVIFNLGTIIGLFYFVFLLQENKPNPLPLLLPIAYGFTIGKYFLWNTFGEEFYIISTSYISYQHDYGFWKTTLKTLKYDFISTNSINQEELTLIFIRYNDEKLQEEIFRTSLAISIVDSELIFNKLNEIKLDEFGHEVNFPIIFPN
ncbi:hypothetical protein EA772_12410 [Pedobacter sp. G11]|uniref:hypothetical protein n=1 Tax=Pedobacter sp. G11 TaxID=2482728 RepID=UPI000F5D7957|nr:hypothetical protein [Pedobacter sp. G11]AZI26105.1 hypothetical protein EA772_12410 [Pedobacter sp. G11]